MALPDSRGYFGNYGGRFVSQLLIPALDELQQAYTKISKEIGFKQELTALLKNYAGRPTRLYYAKNISQSWGADVYLKREDLLHTGAHKINNTLGQVLLAKKMGKKRIIAETGAGQHGVATATACALFKLPCVVYMGNEDLRRQSINQFRMELMGAKVIGVGGIKGTLRNAINEALRDWATNVEDTHYVIGSVVGPHPFPQIVRNFQAVIGDETKKQILKEKGQLPNVIFACVGGGSNAIGMFHAFRDDNNVQLVGIEAGGTSFSEGEHASTLTKGRPGILHGSLSYLLNDSCGQISNVHSISAGLDYPGVGPEHSYLKDIKRAEYASVKDQDALAALRELSEKEGILPALETSHAIAYAKKWLRRELKKKKRFKNTPLIIINLSGRGDKDVAEVKQILKDSIQLTNIK